MTSSTLLKLLTCALAYFAPISVMIHTVLIFILIDFLTGIYASYKTKTKIVSNRLRKTIEKFVFYTGAIIIAHMFQISFANWSNLSQIVAGFIAMTELFSIYENIRNITKLDILSQVRDYLLNVLNKFKNTDNKKDTDAL
jgi:phage-related holin